MHFTGEVAAAVADLNQPSLQWNPPRFLSEDTALDWQIAFDVDQTTLAAYILDVKVELEEEHATQSTTGFQALGEDGDDLYTLNLPYQPDLAVTTDDIAFSNGHPITGTSVTITATVHNLGLQEAPGGFTVRFFKDDPRVSANLIGEETVTSSLAFGVTQRKAQSVSPGWPPTLLISRGTGYTARQLLALVTSWLAQRLQRPS
jgi:hypothetical protein